MEKLLLPFSLHYLPIMLLFHGLFMEMKASLPIKMYLFSESLAQICSEIVSPKNREQGIQNDSSGSCIEKNLTHRPKEGGGK